MTSLLKPSVSIGRWWVWSKRHSIYNKFVEQAQALEPRYLTMVIPARWLFGGRGLDDFAENAHDERIRQLFDYPDSRQVFPSVDVAGGICYFLWDRDNPGTCRIIEMNHDLTHSESSRPLLENGAEVFVRSHVALSILKKVVSVETSQAQALALPEAKRFDQQVSSQKPFGLRTYFRGSSSPSNENDLLVLQSGGRAWTSRAEITTGQELIDKWKVFTSKSSSEHAGQFDKNGQRECFQIRVIPPGSVVTETYVLRNLRQ